MGELLAGVGDLVFTMLVGYIGALEFLYVVRHLYHWTFRHPDGADDDADSLKRLQENMRSQLATAAAREASAGTQVMQDGVPYKDGFRIDSQQQQQQIEQLKEAQRLREEKERRRKEMEAELARQRKIEEETRQQLQRAEAELERQRQQEAALAEAERAQEQQQRQLEEQREAEESARKLLAVEREREEAERARERERREAEESARKMLAAEREREEAEERLREEQERADEELARRLVEAERQREAEERLREEQEQEREDEDEEIARRLVEAERQREAEERERDLLQQRGERKEGNEDEAEAAEQSQLLLDAEREQERKQRLKEENALKFLEAELEMVELQQHLEEGAVLQRQLSANQQPMPVVEEPCVRREVSPLTDNRESGKRQTVKTQFGQTSSESTSGSPRSLVFPDISDDGGSSTDPTSSQFSSLGTGHPSADESAPTEGLLEREAPDGEDTGPAVQYTDEYLRSLDGIKQRPLVREDGSGRRRAFKKRRSSGSSNSSRDSRTSREDELRMFTSLEEEEMKSSAVAAGESGGDAEGDFTAIKYSSGESSAPTTPSTLKVKGHRRHKRSPAKDAKASEAGESARGSLEMLDEEGSNPWGELVPEHYKDTAFWKREKAMSIDEEEIDLERAAGATDAPTHVAKASSFEDATDPQNEEALAALRKQGPAEKEDTRDKDMSAEATRNEKNTNLRTSPTAEDSPSSNRSSSSPGLRRSPRVDEIDQYEERWKETAGAAASTETSETPLSTPSISVLPSPDIGSWRDEHDLLLEGLSDFYDFTASTNPSRSRSTSRNPSRASTPSATQTRFTFPKNVAYSPDRQGDEEAFEHIGHVEHIEEKPSAVDVYDDTGTWHEIPQDARDVGAMAKLVDSLGDSPALDRQPASFPVDQLSNVADDPGRHESVAITATVAEMRGVADVPSIAVDADETSRERVAELVESLRVDRSRSRSRSRSPLPTADNIRRSLDKRREKLVQHNDEVYSRMMEALEATTTEAEAEVQVLTTEVTIAESSETTVVIEGGSESGGQDDMNSLVESLRANRCRSQSRSRSPLPTADNVQRSLDSRRGKLIQHNDEILERLKQSQSPVDRGHGDSSPVQPPTISVEYVEEGSSTSTAVLVEGSNEAMSDLVESLRVARASSRSRSKSPMRVPSDANLAQSVEARQARRIAQNEELFERLIERSRTPEQQLAVEYVYEILESTDDDNEADDEPRPTSRPTIEMPRGRSRSRTPSRSRSLSPERSPVAEDVADNAEAYGFLARPRTRPNFEDTDTGRSADRLEHLSDYYDFHQMLNVEASRNKTTTQHADEQQRLVDEAALRKLQTAREDVELPTNKGVDGKKDEDQEEEETESESDELGPVLSGDRLRRLKCTPTTPDYDRSVSSEWRDVQRIKNEMLASGFKRSTYVGESMDLGSEFEELRRQTAAFRRSQSRSRSPGPDEVEGVETARRRAEERRQIQDAILAEMTAVSQGQPDDETRLGARPKGDRRKSSEEAAERSVSQEWADTMRLKEELLHSGFQRSTYVGESMDMSAQFEDLRRDAAEFRRSRSRSRSPLDAEEAAAVATIEVEAVKRDLQDRILDEIEKTTISFQDFSRHLNVDFLDSERRASDSALIKRPEILFQFQDNDADPDMDMEPDSYHHYRRYSLCQDTPVEEYPSDDFVYVSQVEVRTLNGTRTWTREDFYSEDFGAFRRTTGESSEEEERNLDYVIVDREDEEGEEDLSNDNSDDSEDERRTVVDVEDEIDEDICDFNERGPADESHHEQSECEEADREVDRYKDRRADDWKDVGDVGDLLYYGNVPDGDEEEEEEDVENDEEGAVGGFAGQGEGTPYDSDSFAIDQIYDDAIRNRKQSGILRDYDCILQEIQNSSSDNGDRYALWAKTRQLERDPGTGRGAGVESSLSFIESERRYLGDATTTARSSARLRSRYGYVPVVRGNGVEEAEVDLDYRPKREYNWRKNFRLDEDEPRTDGDADGDGSRGATEDYREEAAAEAVANEGDERDERDEGCVQHQDTRKFSLGGESITLFSRSPDREQLAGVVEEDSLDTYAEPEAEPEPEPNDVAPTDPEPKKIKRKSKKKTRKGSKGGTDQDVVPKDEDDSESQVYSRRSSSIQMESATTTTTTDSPKRKSKSRSRRSSRNSLGHEDLAELNSPRSSLGGAEPPPSLDVNGAEALAAPAKKKATTSKKRKKAKETFVHEPEIQEEHLAEEAAVVPVSLALTPESAGANVLSSLSPQHSVCVTPASIESDSNERPQPGPPTPAPAPSASTAPTAPRAPTTAAAPSAPSSASVPRHTESFDMLKDGNFYPLF